MKGSNLVALLFQLVLAGAASAAAQGPGPEQKPGPEFGIGEQERFSVRVIDAMLQPIIGAQLSVVDTDGAVVASGTSGRGGCWTMPARDAWWTCRASAPGYAANSVRLHRRHSRWARPDQCIRLFDAVTLRGTVRDDRGEPVPLAHVCVDWVGAPFVRLGRTDLPEARCDGSGQFAIRGVPIADVTLRAWAEGHVLGNTLVKAGTTSSDLVVARGVGCELDLQVDGVEFRSGQFVQIRMAWSNFEGDLRLPAPLRERTILGPERVVLRGLPVDGSQLMLSSHVHGSGLEVEPRSMSARRMGPAGQPLNGAARFVVRRVEPPVAAVRGVLRGERGERLAGCGVQLRSIGGEELSTKSDEHGRFGFEGVVGVAEGTPLYFSCPDPLLVLVEPHKTWRRPFRPPSYRFLRNADFQLVAVASARVQGRLRTEDGANAEGLVVGLELANAAGSGPVARRGAQAGVSADGRFEIDGFAPFADPFFLAVDGPSGAGRTGPLRLGKDGSLQGVELVVAPPIEVRGLVTDAADQPVAGAWVKLSPKPQQGRRATPATFTLSGRDGRYLLRGVSAGSYELWVTLGDRARWHSDAFELAPSQQLTIHPSLK